jgi:two-component system CheB/CheR fusion protein
VCAVGASAGGLEPLERFFAGVLPPTGMAFVVIQHLSPDYKSLMAELLARHTRLPVVRATDGIALEPDTIYLNPPKTDMVLEGGRLRLREPSLAPGALHLPIDVCFQSMAATLGEFAVGVILSGTGSDGTRGARAIKEANGLVLVQSPDEAQFDGMPQSVVSTGLPDQVSDVAELPGLVQRYAALLANATSPTRQPRAGLAPESQFHRVLALLRDRLGADFSGYKPQTMLRRIERRMGLLRGLDWEQYLTVLDESPRELRQLQRDLLIGVTRFIRDPEAFAVLRDRVVPDLFRLAARQRELRVWVPACSTGEEAYSIAMLLLEQAPKQGPAPIIKVFATDIDPDSVEFASNGLYPESIAADLEPERLSRFFLRDGDRYRAARSLREHVIFARHNLLRDPPLTRMHLVSCRNMLIYLQPEVQPRAIALLGYGLQPQGVLFLGPSETLGGLAHLFEPIDARWRIYRSLSPSRQRLLDVMPLGSRRVTIPDELARSRPRAAVPDASVFERVYQELADVLQLKCLLVDAEFNLLHTFGDAGALLQMPQGRTTLEVSRLLPRPLATMLRAALARTLKTGADVSYENVDPGDGSAPMRIQVRPIDLGPDRGRCFAVFFSRGTSPLADVPSEAMQDDTRAESRLSVLEQELQYTREHLQATIEELETSNEELQATNEELLASNEELQSTNEELQSVNEELHTINAEYQSKIVELTAVSNDIDNLLRTSGVGVVFLDQTLRLRKYTTAATRILNLLPHDIGRPFEHVVPTAHGVDLIAPSRRVLATGTTESIDIMLPDGSEVLVRVLPYLDEVLRPSGLVLAMLEVSEMRSRERQLQAVIDAIPGNVAVLGPDGVIRRANRYWTEFARANEAPDVLGSGVGLNYLDACRARPDDPGATTAENGIRGVLRGDLPFFELEYPCHGPGRHRWYRMVVSPLSTGGAVVQHFDITSRVVKEDQLRHWIAAVRALDVPGLQERLPADPRP